MYDDIFDKDFVERLQKQQEEQAIADFKTNKKRPYLERKDLMKELFRRKFEDNLYEDLPKFVDNSSGELQVELLDKYIEQRLNEYEEYVTRPIDDYYRPIFTEIDNMKIKVERRSKES